MRGSDMENRDEYKKLYTHLCGLQVKEWETTFGEIESIIGFRLPEWARQTGDGGQTRDPSTAS